VECIESMLKLAMHTCKHADVKVHACIHVHKLTCMHKHTCIPQKICMCVCASIRRICTRYVYSSTCIHLYACVCMCVCLLVCVSVYVCIMYVYAYMCACVIVYAVCETRSERLLVCMYPCMYLLSSSHLPSPHSSLTWS
jgi:hypothetical protein